MRALRRLAMHHPEALLLNGQTLTDTALVGIPGQVQLYRIDRGWLPFLM